MHDEKQYHSSSSAFPHQPPLAALVVSVHKSFKSQLSKLLHASRLVMNSDIWVSKHHFPGIYSGPFKAAVTASNLHNGFRQTGLYLLNPNVVQKEFLNPYQKMPTITNLPDPRNAPSTASVPQKMSGGLATHEPAVLGVTAHSSPVDSVETVAGVTGEFKEGNHQYCQRWCDLCNTDMTTDSGQSKVVFCDFGW